MGILKSIFGGSSSKSSATSTPTDMTPNEFKALRGGLGQQLTNLSGTDADPLGGIPQFGQPMVAPVGAGEAEMLALLRQPNMTGAGRSALLELTMAGNFLPGQPGSNPFMAAAVQAAQRQTTDEYLRGVEKATGSATAAGHLVQGGFRGGFNLPGGPRPGSTAFDRIVADATNQYGQTLGDIATSMTFAGYELERGRQMAAIPISQKEVSTTIENMQAQSLPRLVDQLGIENAMKEFSERKAMLTEMLKILAGLTSPTVANTATSTATSTTSPNLFGAIFPKGLFNPAAR